MFSGVAAMQRLSFRVDEEVFARAYTVISSSPFSFVMGIKHNI